MFIAAALLGLSACGNSPREGIMLGHLPAPPEKSKENPNRVYATPTPDETPVAETTEPEPQPSRVPGPWVPAPTYTPWLPFPTWTPGPQPSAKPSTVPVPMPSSKPSTTPTKPPSVWPSVHPSARPSSTPPETTPSPVPVAPVDASNAIELKSSFFNFLTRPFAQAFGTFDEGRLEQPDPLPNSGEGYVKVFQERNRGFATLDLRSIVQGASKEIHRDLPATESVQIGDISDKNGGQLGGHASHQIGLDADIVLFKKDHREMRGVGSNPGATGFDEQFVDKKGKVSANFDLEANWRFIQLLESTGRLDRIFIDQHLKRAFCEYAESKGMRDEWKETLRKLRHWPNHADHMHVRISCPPNSKKCKPFPALPAGDGCGNLNRGSGLIWMGDDALSAPPEDPNEHGC